MEIHFDLQIGQTQTKKNGNLVILTNDELQS